MPEARSERLPHFGIPGFETLPPETQAIYLKVPPDHLALARPVIEEAIRKNGEAAKVISYGKAEQVRADNLETTAHAREGQANAAIKTFRQAEAGDPEARKDLLDKKRELLGEDPSDDDVFATILENDSGNPLAQDTVLAVMLSDEKADAYQGVLDLFNAFRGDLPSADTALKPEQQIDLFLKLTEGGGNLGERMFFVRQVLDIVTRKGAQNLFQGLTERGVLKDGELVEANIERLGSVAKESLAS